MLYGLFNSTVSIVNDLFLKFTSVFEGLEPRGGSAAAGDLADSDEGPEPWGFLTKNDKTA